MGGKYIYIYIYIYIFKKIITIQTTPITPLHHWQKGLLFGNPNPFPSTCAEIEVHKAHHYLQNSTCGGKRYDLQAISSHPSFWRRGSYDWGIDSLNGSLMFYGQHRVTINWIQKLGFLYQKPSQGEIQTCYIYCPWLAPQFSFCIQNVLLKENKIIHKIYQTYKQFIVVG